MKRLTGLAAVLAAMFLSAHTVLAVGIQVQIDEVFAGANGDSSVQFIKLRFVGSGDNLWGPQSGETVGRLRLVFHDAAGLQTGEFVFPSDAPIGVQDPVRLDYRVLIATQDFANLAGMPVPDFIIPKNVLAIDGKVCVKSNPANPNAPDINLCLSYGNFVDSTETDTLGQPAGAPADPLPIMGASSLKRTGNLTNYGTGQFNADFDLAPANPKNSAGNAGMIQVLSQTSQGKNLFEKETFYGNGRTCMHCHRPDDGHGLNTNTIAFLSPVDPLFVAEFNPALADLENSCLMRGARGLILENIDGFENPPVFRGSPHLFNIALTAPYGLSGEFADLQTFTITAVKQHAPKTLARNSDPNLGPLDFRLPTTPELAAMEAFMESITLPADGDFDIQRMIDAAVTRGGDAAAIERGRALFFGENETASEAKCFKCHTGPVLANANGQLGGGNRKFNTGVSELPINNFLDECLGGSPLPGEANGTREFSTPALIGVSLTAPYFHDNSIPTLRESVAFYNTFEFNTSPSAQIPQVGQITMTEQDIDDITAFLEALVEPVPEDCNNNTIDDIIDLNDLTSFNCNNNHRPDECELAANDCNGNLVPDECDLIPMKFLSAVDTTVSSPGHHVDAADLDADGDDDLMIVGWNTARVEILLNNNGNFTSWGTVTTGQLPRWSTTADFDLDGDLDIIVANLFSDYMSLLLNNGNDGFGSWQGLASEIVIPMNAPNQFDGGTFSVLSADLNNDGLPDVASIKRFSNQIAILLNQGLDNGNQWLGFAAPVDHPNTGGIVPVAISSGLLDGDNKIDLLVANEASDSITVHLNDGAGGFPTSTNVTAGVSPSGAAIADFDGDFINDVAITNRTVDLVTIMYGDGAGAFANPVTLVVGSYPFGAGPNGIIAQDVDSDHDMDLFVSNGTSKNISVLMNNGNGIFSRLLNFGQNSSPDGLTIANVDGSGGPDIVAVRFTGSDVSVLLNDTLPFGGDCNMNGVPDSCDIQSSLSADINANLVPDECEHLGDIDNDGDVDIVDAQLLAGVLVGTEATPGYVVRSDLSADNERDGEDIQFFVQVFLSQ